MVESIGQAVSYLQDRSDEELESLHAELMSADATLWQGIEDLDESE